MLKTEQTAPSLAIRIHHQHSHKLCSCNANTTYTIPIPSAPTDALVDSPERLRGAPVAGDIMPNLIS
jgi:hypothetical protein